MAVSFLFPSSTSRWDFGIVVLCSQWMERILYFHHVSGFSKDKNVVKVVEAGQAEQVNKISL